MKTWIGVVSLASLVGGAALIRGADVHATRFTENPLVTLAMSRSIGDNANGPTVIRVPTWVPHGRSMSPVVLKVENTAFYRPQPDPINSPPGAYTHLASQRS